jgi:hypothetical protein
MRSFGHVATSRIRAIWSSARSSAARRTAAIAAMLAVAISVAVFRVLAHRDLPNDHFMHLAWAQQLLMGELPGRDFVDPGMPLAYAMSAIVQAFWPGPFSDAVLTSALLGAAAAALGYAATRLTGSVILAVVALALQVWMMPRLYSYPKILVPAMTVALVAWYGRAPAATRLAVLAVWTVAAGLLRHDLGLFAGLATAPALVAAHLPARWPAVRAVVHYVALVIVAALPYLLFLQATGGIAVHLHNGFEFSKSDVHQVGFVMPSFEPWMDGVFGEWPRANALAAIVYLTRGLAVVGLVLLVAVRGAGASLLAPATAALALLVVYQAAILRHPIEARVPDLASVLPLVLLWAVAEAGRAARTLRGRGIAGAAAAAVVVVLAAVPTTVATASAWRIGRMSDQLQETRIRDGSSKVLERLRLQRAAGTDWPWPPYWPAGDLPVVVRYIEACTAPTDRLLMTWSDTEYFHFTRRGFAAGHAWFLPPRAFVSEGDQALMIARLRAQYAPLALDNVTNVEFATTYRTFAAYVHRSYRPVGSFIDRRGDEIVIRLRADLEGTGTWGPDGWPCGFVERRSLSPPAFQSRSTDRKGATPVSVSRVTKW